MAIWIIYFLARYGLSDCRVMLRVIAEWYKVGLIGPAADAIYRTQISPATVATDTVPLGWHFVIGARTVPSVNKHRQVSLSERDGAPIVRSIVLYIVYTSDAEVTAFWQGGPSSNVHAKDASSEDQTVAALYCNVRQLMWLCWVEGGINIQHVTTAAVTTATCVIYVGTIVIWCSVWTAPASILLRRRDAH